MIENLQKVLKLILKKKILIDLMIQNYYLPTKKIHIHKNLTVLLEVLAPFIQFLKMVYIE